MAMLLERARLCAAGGRGTPDPVAGDGQLLLRVLACGVCRTDLHIADGDLARPKLPLVLGHEIVGEVVGLGAGRRRVCRRPACRRALARLDVRRVRPPPRRPRENLCDRARFTGYDIDGGSPSARSPMRHCFAPPPGPDGRVAAWLCAGLIGYRSLQARRRRRAPPGHLAGFGAAAHVSRRSRWRRAARFYAFTRDGDTAARDSRAHARRGGPGCRRLPPVALDAALIFAPVGALVPAALSATAKGAAAWSAAAST